MFSHLNNITQKERIASDGNVDVCREIRRKYESYIGRIDLNDTLTGDFVSSVNALNEYLDYAKTVEAQNRFFNWRSDFASSIVPEYLYRVISHRLAADGIPAEFSTRNSIVELTLSGEAGAGWNIRRKNQDLCVGTRSESVTISGEEISFVVPTIAFEVKTNIDINKLNGLDFSAERLKRTFPSARYMLVTETIDFSLRENHAGAIDEIFVLRRQMRSAARRNKDPLKHEVFADLVDHVQRIMKKATQIRGHVYDRLEGGKLINV